MIPFEMFIKDLELIENSNRREIRIFKTKVEVEYFKTDGGDLTGTHDASQSFAGRSKYVPPKREPLYMRRSDKNTFYTESNEIDFDQQPSGTNFSFN